MAANRHIPEDLRRVTFAVIAAAFVMFIVSAAGAADRVVLGEYFTNLF